MSSGSLWLAAARRVHKGLRHLAALVVPPRPDASRARAVLSPEAWPLFSALSAVDQQHALCVLDRLSGQAIPISAPLAQAALLHDCGKAGAGLNVFWRTASVLLKAVGMLSRLAIPSGPRWRVQLYRQLHHAERGAVLCEQAHCEPATVALVRWHDRTPPGAGMVSIQDLELLQAADEAC
ncbi:MAG: hypothetical protein ACOX2L_05925 [Anaerolineae bacterium]|nr:hypothetical protein [Chloroflexota bacterium]